jgi:hypothetical protein
MQKRCYKPYVKNPKNGKCTKSKKVVETVECRKNKIAQVMREFKYKKLKTPYMTVKNAKQAIAIALSLAKKQC